MLARSVWLSAFLFCLVCVASPGCGGSGGDSEYTTGGVKIKVLHPPAGGSSSTGKTQGDYSWTSFQWKDTRWKPLTVVVNKHRLNINGQDYGALNDGDRVLIDARPLSPLITV